MPKPEERIKNGPTAVSDYPDLISDTDVVFGNAHIIPHVIDKVLDKAEISVTFGDKNVAIKQPSTANFVANNYFCTSRSNSTPCLSQTRHTAPRTR